MSEQQGVLQEEVSFVEVHDWQRTLVHQVLRVVFLAAIPALLFSSYFVWRDGRGGLIPFYVLGFAAVGIMRFWKKAPYVLQVATLLLVLYMFAVLSLMRGGLSSNATLFLLGLIFVSAIFLGRQAAIGSIVVAGLTMATAGWLYSTGQALVPYEMQLITARPVAWATYTFILLMLGVFFVAAQTYMQQYLTEALTRSLVMGRKLTLDREQAQHEAQLRREHAEQLRWVVSLSHTLTSIRQQEDLTRRVVRELARTFDIYQANLYLLERTGAVLNLTATAGALGEALPQAGGDIAFSARVAPARAAQIGREQMALLLPGELPHFPESRVEISLPLSIRGEVIGVLDIHSRRSSFSEEELQIFRIVAGQVAASLDVLRLIEESRARVQEMQMLYTQYALTSWRALLESQKAPSFVAGKVPEAQMTALAQEAMAMQQPRSAWLDEAGMYLLIVPLVANGVTAGYLAFTRTAEKGDWDTETRELIRMAVERLGTAIDNTRMLLEARQQLLYNERLGRLGDLIWQTPDPETIMEQSVRTLGRFLEASEVQLYMTATPGGGRRGRGTQPLILNPEERTAENG
ncbi:MAG TPA: GAF domain-containing protein [Anaerolineae bacterium]|nr:GAF domain-containing protein [Anaerolineae bacterium]HQK13024.1 GAF domain-containing protein [Anaerolineae bacterium]